MKQFCDDCGVSNDLHDELPSERSERDCEHAKAKASLIERFGVFR
jgi:hypothetical protein